MTSLPLKMLRMMNSPSIKANRMMDRLSQNSRKLMVNKLMKMIEWIDVV